ncbi:hypothetical protein ABH931_002662 [Streptacidiphilus sp. MAP12-33]|uniref:hypothetical protein n=1 Tax=Streptacidiphilus sp. MAP12-33 TaxID=3156266 RepID=UPI00351770CF
MLVSLLVFVGCATLLMGVHFPWTPHAESDRWFVALTVAVFLGTGVGGALAWWAGREEASRGGTQEGAEAGAGRQVVQRARVARGGTNIMAGRDVRIRQDERRGHERD